MNNSGNLKEHINWLKENRQTTLDLISPEECKRRINELDLSRADLESCRKLSEQHIRNARKDEHNNLWEEAVREWNLALTLDPVNPDKLLYLAEAYYRRYVHTGLFEFLDTSRRLLKKGLKLFPGNSKLRNRLNTINRSIRRTRGKQRAFISFLVILIFIVLGIAFRGPIEIFLKQWQKPEVPPAAAEETVTPKLKSGPVQTNVLNRSDKDLKVLVSMSSMQVGSEAYSYTLNGTVSHSSKKITGLTLQQSWYSDNDELLFRKIHPVVDEKNRKYYRKGDSLSFSDFIHETRIPDTLAYIQLTVLDLETEEDKDQTELSDKKIIWQQERPEGINVSIKSRESEFLGGTLSDYYQGVFILRNEGNKAIHNLKIYPVWFAAENRVEPVGGPRSAISEKEKALEAGETRTLVFTFRFPADSLDAESREKFAISIKDVN